MIFEQILHQFSAQLLSWHLRVTHFPWAVVVALTVLVLAHVIKHFVNDTIENEKTYFTIIAAFLVIYVVAAIAVGSLSPAAFAAS